MYVISNNNFYLTINNINNNLLPMKNAHKYYLYFVQYCVSIGFNSTEIL